MLDQNGKPIFDFNNMTHHKKPDLARRMARIEAYIRGIRKMIGDKGYPDIVQQVSAVRAALDG